MQVDWLKGYTDSEKRKKEVLSYTTAFNDLMKVLETWEETGSPDYTSPSWSHEQADRNGANRMLQKVIKLIDIHQKG